MNIRYACGTSEHLVARRSFLGLTVAGAGAALGGASLFGSPTVAASLRSLQKRVVVFNMHGGVSQLETWDPKPGTDTGGPCRAIQTSVPGIQVCELLPETAKQMHNLCLVRGVNTSENDHGKGRHMMLTGRRRSPASVYPELGAVTAKALAPEDSPLPGHIVITPGGSGGRGNDSAYLGPRYASVSLGNGKPPRNTTRPGNVTEQADVARQDFRRMINKRFLDRRRTAVTEAYAYSYEQALKLMQQRAVFDVAQEPEKDVERYGKGDFGRHCLLARRLLERGITFVQLSHSNYDTHNENFSFHIEQLGEFDRGFSCFVNDLADRGMLDSTLIIVLSEFGRTPRINNRHGRDHWSAAWSVCVGGAKTPRGHAYGKTNANGTKVDDGQVDHGMLFHTYLQAVGVDSTDTFDIDGRDVPIADPAAAPVDELLT